jgi:hypothetical protein
MCTEVPVDHATTEPPLVKRADVESPLSKFAPLSTSDARTVGPKGANAPGWSRFVGAGAGAGEGAGAEAGAGAGAVVVVLVDPLDESPPPPPPHADTSTASANGIATVAFFFMAALQQQSHSWHTFLDSRNRWRRTTPLNEVGGASRRVDEIAASAERPFMSFLCQ